MLQTTFKLHFIKTRQKQKEFSSNIILYYVALPEIMSEIKDEMEDAGEKMKRGAKKAGNRMEEGAEEAKDKVD